MTQIKSEEELLEYFEPEIINGFKSLVMQGLGNYKKRKNHSWFKGCFITPDLPTKKGKRTNIYVEYVIDTVPNTNPVVYSASFDTVYLFDIIPDEFLDRYNELKKDIDL